VNDRFCNDHRWLDPFLPKGRGRKSASYWHALCGIFLQWHIVFLSGASKGGAIMSTATTIQAHIAYELIGGTDPDVVAIDFLSHVIADPAHADELGEQLDLLITPDLPRNFVIDFENVRSLGSTAFGAIVAFARKARQVKVCNIHGNLRLGAALSGLDDCAEYAISRQAAINLARQATKQDLEDTGEYPIFVG
jgi:anti-anti-sigma regulatory factor